MTSSIALAQLQSDLHWSIASPPLLHGDHDDFSEWPNADFFALLWLQHAAPPIHHDDVAQLHPMRLGHYFEHLWHLWLREHRRYQVVLANEAWRENGITLGETDLLLRDRETGEIEHWELAVKFYLGYGDLSLRSHWHGPQFRDRLDHKFEHLKYTQTRLTKTPSVQQQLRDKNITIARVRCIVKGRLFLPWSDYHLATQIEFAAPGALRGFWLTQSHWRQLAAEFSFCRRLSREQFLAPLTPNNSQEDWFIVPDSELERPAALAICDEHGDELYRGFVVPDGWPQQAAMQQRHDGESTGHIAGRQR